jgi:nitric oxide reductase NorD protein
MKHQKFKEELTGLIQVDVLNYWEVEDYVEQLAGYPEEVQQEILRQVGIIWPVSHALCFTFLDQVQNGLTCLHYSQLSEWVNAILDVYEKDGLQLAGRFMAEVESNFLCRIRGETGLSLAEAAGRLLPYIRGLSGRGLDLAGSPEIYTDGQTIFLPPEINLFPKKSDNFLVYKLFATFQWGLLTAGTFEARMDPEQPLARELTARYGRPWQKDAPFPTCFCALFPDPRLAADLFGLLETLRVSRLLRAELPGLMRDSERVFEQLHQRRPDLSLFAGTDLLLEALNQWALTRRTKGRLPGRERKIFDQAIRLLTPLARAGGSVEDSMILTVALYRNVAEFQRGYGTGHPPVLTGRLQPAAVHAARLRRQEETKQQFIKTFGAILPPELSGEDRPELNSPRTAGQPARLPADEGAAMLPPAGQPGEDSDPKDPLRQASPEYIVIGEQEIRIPDEMQSLVREIRNDFGRIPDRYISAALQHAGTGNVGGPGPAPGEGDEASGPLVYDEWDFRRAGFRKNWCLLLEKELLPVRSTFVENTLAKYRGQLRQLKRQFEMMRLQQRFVRRQKDGDEIDLDAAIEALTDLRAGCSASEKLFIRLNRDERNIDTVFLVDMSSSTEGWVSTALKETLVLMCEALEVLGDRYAIYGFSGMRRLRSELYHIKRLEENYDEKVKGRISAITPKDYTRMGPPIRHLTKLLATSEAKVRLLITLSDGKPEDYDDYKGDYAIEDTRHALIEAKAAAIHPFCITIDQEAQLYIPHMYGEVNYIFIDDVKQLPLRMPEIYRALTT